MFAFGPPRPRRRPSLTAMIDVVFLLLIFFMLASRFGQPAVLTLMPGQAGGGTWTGPPRLVTVGPDRIALNGRTLPLEALEAGLATLMDSPDDTVILRPKDGAVLQDIVSVLDRLQAAGLTQMVVLD